MSNVNRHGDVVRWPNDCSSAGRGHVIGHHQRPRTAWGAEVDLEGMQ